VRGPTQVGLFNALLTWGCMSGLLETILHLYGGLLNWDQNLTSQLLLSYELIPLHLIAQENGVSFGIMPFAAIKRRCHNEVSALSTT